MKSHRFRASFVATMATILSFPCLTLADTIVDTGPGDLIATGVVLSAPDINGNYQSLAGKFSLTSATSVTSVEGWIGQDFFNSSGSLVISVGLSPGDALFSGSVLTSQGMSDSHWMGLTGLDWSLGAGDYWVTFSATGGFSGWMSTMATNPLPNYAYFNSEEFGWVENPSLNLGVRIMGGSNSVPDGSATLVLFGGAVLCLFTIRRIFAR